MIAVAIPSRCRFDELNRLIDQLEGYEVLIMDNGYTAKERGILSERCSTVQLHGKRIYEMWNLAWSWAKASGSEYLAILNDDVILGPDTLRIMESTLKDSQYWVVSPDPDGMGPPYQAKNVRGSYKDHGMLGHCFAFKVDNYSKAPFDEEYLWWGGDDQFAKDTIDQGGKIARITGLFCRHIGEATSQQFPETEEMKAHDIELMRTRGLWP